MGISIYPVPALRKCPPPGFARSFLAGFWTELEMRNPMHLRELVCKFFRNEVSSIFTISSIVSSGEILRLVFHLFVSHKCWLKGLLEVWCGSNRLVLHPSPDKTFSQILTQRLARDLVWIQHLALHLVIMIKFFSVVTSTQNAVKGAWKRFEKVLT